MSKDTNGTEPGEISALDVTTYGLIREVSVEALDFYANGLFGLYLPEDFKEAHKDSYDVERWDLQQRLRGKFGRFVLKLEGEDSSDVDTPDEVVLLMGTIICVDLIDSRGNMQSLRHFEFRHKLFDVFRSRGLDQSDFAVDRVDYGSTSIVLGANGDINEIEVGGRSIDYGRADEIGRQETCELFKKAVGDAIGVVSKDPIPDERDYVIRD